MHINKFNIRKIIYTFMGKLIKNKQNTNICIYNCNFFYKQQTANDK